MLTAKPPTAIADLLSVRHTGQPLALRVHPAVPLFTFLCGADHRQDPHRSVMIGLPLSVGCPREPGGNASGSFRLPTEQRTMKPELRNIGQGAQVLGPCPICVNQCPLWVRASHDGSGPQPHQSVISTWPHQTHRFQQQSWPLFGRSAPELVMAEYRKATA